MLVEEINGYIIEEVGLAEDQGDNVSIRLNLSDSSSIEIWFDKENEYYTWSNAACGYEDTYSVVSDIMEWLDANDLTVTDMVTI